MQSVQMTFDEFLSAIAQPAQDAPETGEKMPLYLQCDSQEYKGTGFCFYGMVKDTFAPESFTLTADYLLDHIPGFAYYMQRPHIIDPREIICLHGTYTAQEAERGDPNVVELIDGQLVHRAPIYSWELPAHELYAAWEKRTPSNHFD